MSWPTNYLKKLQVEIERYKDKLLYIANHRKDLQNQPDLLKISREVDVLIIKYQNFRRMLSTFQQIPFNIDFFMNKSFDCIKDNEVVSGRRRRNQFLFITNDRGTIVGVIPPQAANLIARVTFCNLNCTIWRAQEILKENDCSYLVVQEKGVPKGVIEKALINRLCQKKELNRLSRKKLNRNQDSFDNIPISIFVLDKDFYIDYANTEAIKNFNAVLPHNYLFQKADLIFSGLFNKNYDEFVYSDFWQHLCSGESRSEIEVKLLNYISLLTNIKFVKNREDEKIIISFVNIGDLKQKVEELVLTTDELSQALSLFLPHHIEKILRTIPEYKDVYNYKTKKITIASKIDDGCYWHVVNCLRILSQIDRTGILAQYKINKDILVNAIMLHDIGKKQPDLNVGDTVDTSVFEKSKLHAARSARFCKGNGYSKDIILLVRYHHHKEQEMPKRFPKRLFVYLKTLQTIDGLSAAVTRRNAFIRFELSQNCLIVHEENRERPEFCNSYTIEFNNKKKLL